jgi:hypothetical protein
VLNVKQEPRVKVKKEPTTPMKKEKRWWEEELELAAVVRHPDDPKDAMCQRLATACLMSAIDCGNFIVVDSNEGSDDE